MHSPAVEFPPVQLKRNKRATALHLCRVKYHFTEHNLDITCMVQCLSVSATDCKLASSKIPEGFFNRRLAWGTSLETQRGTINQVWCLWVLVILVKDFTWSFALESGFVVCYFIAISARWEVNSWISASGRGLVAKLLLLEVQRQKLMQLWEFPIVW